MRKNYQQICRRRAEAALCIEGWSCRIAAPALALLAKEIIWLALFPAIPRSRTGSQRKGEGIPVKIVQGLSAGSPTAEACSPKSNSHSGRE